MKKSNIFVIILVISFITSTAYSISLAPKTGDKNKTAVENTVVTVADKIVTIKETESKYVTT